MSEKETPPRSSGSTWKLQKALAQGGLGSRRDMEELVRAGRVTDTGKLEHYSQTPR